MMFQNPTTGAFGVYISTLANMLGRGVFDIVKTPSLALPWTAYTETTAPTAGFGQVAVEVAPVAGVQAWVLQYAAVPVATLLAELQAVIEAERVRRAALPFTFDFGATLAVSDASVSAAAGPRPMQATPADLVNLQLAFSAALALVVAGAPTTTYPLRTADNVNVQTTAHQALAAIGALYARQTALIFHAAAAKAAAAKLTTVAALAGVDPSAGWPS